MTDSDATYGLVLSFTGLYPTMAEERAFVHGFEVALLYQRMRAGAEAEIKEATHEANRVVIARAAAALGWDIECTPSATPEWDFTTLRKARAERPNPHGLRIVKETRL